MYDDSDIDHFRSNRHLLSLELKNKGLPCCSVCEVVYEGPLRHHLLSPEHNEAKYLKTLDMFSKNHSILQIDIIEEEMFEKFRYLFLFTLEDKFS
jgi:hypothetical protein